MFRLLFTIMLCALMIFHSTFTHALDYFGFTLGMSQADALALAQRRGYNFQPSGPGSYAQTGNNGPRYMSLCGGKLFSIGQSFDGTLETFIGMVRERQARWGEPVWTVNQQFATGVQPVKQVSTLSAKWDDAVGQYQPELSLFSFGNDLGITGFVQCSQISLQRQTLINFQQLLRTDRFRHGRSHSTFGSCGHLAPHGSFMLRAIFLGHSAVSSSSQSMSLAAEEQSAAICINPYWCCVEYWGHASRSNPLPVRQNHTPYGP